MERRFWTATEDLYLTETDARLTAAQQADQLGRSVNSVIQRRDRLIREGRLLHKRPRWTAEQDEELFQLVEAGLSLPRLAKTLQRSPQAITGRLWALGTSLSHERNSGAVRTRSATQVAQLLGVSTFLVLQWIRGGDLPATKNRGAVSRSAPQQRRRHLYRMRQNAAGTARYTRPTAWYLISDEHLMTFLSNRLCWMLVDPAHITDPDWRTFAEQARQYANGTWWTTHDLAAHLGVERRAAGSRLSRGCYPGVKKYGSWYVWSADVPARRAA